MRTVRFIVQVDESPRELVSVRPLKSGDLIVSFKRPLNDETEQGDVRSLEDRRTVHMSPNSEGTTITRTERREDGTTLRSAVFIHGPKEALLFPISSRRCGDVRPKRFQPNSKAGDKKILVARQAPITSSLVYHLVVARELAMLPRFDVYMRFDAEFENFAIGMYVIFMNLPSMDNHDVLQLMTSQEQRNGVAVGEGPQRAGGTQPLNAAGLFQMIRAFDDRFAALLVKRLAKVVGEPMPGTAWGEHEAHFTRFPIGPGQVVDLRY